MTPEERKAAGVAMAAARKAKIDDSFGQGRKRGSCKARTAEQQAQFVAEQTLEVKRIIKKMAAAGDLPDDPRAEEALATGLTILRTSESEERKLKAAGLLLTRSEEHTSELQSLVRISYAVFCLKKKKNTTWTIMNTMIT